MPPKPITVFTPTYNRAYSLPQLYKSLCRQTSQDFVWLVIDDGSTDDTAQLVQSWIKENKIDIQYIYQENQGMHGAHNTAYKNIVTELNVCIDSDDFMPTSAIDNILKFWNENGSKKYGGIVGLDVDKDDKIIGNKLPENRKSTTLYGYYARGGKGDKKLVLRTEIVKKYPPYPLFEGERFVPLGILYLMIDQVYELLILNKPLCVVEYMPDGSSMNILKQYTKNPKGFLYARKLRMNYPVSFLENIKNVLHYVSFSLFAKEKRIIRNSPKRLLTFFLFPLGVLLNQYIQHKVKKSN